MLPCSDDGFSGSGSSVGAWLNGKGEADPGSGGGGLELGPGGLLAYRSIDGAGFDGSGEPFDSVRGLGLCCLGSCSRQWPESDDLGIGGAFVRSAAFAGHLPDGSRPRRRRKGDVSVPSLAASTTLMRTLCS